MFNNGYSISFHGIFSRMDSQYHPQIILSMEYKMVNRKRMNKGISSDHYGCGNQMGIS